MPFETFHQLKKAKTKDEASTKAFRLIKEFKKELNSPHYQQYTLRKLSVYLEVLVEQYDRPKGRLRGYAIEHIHGLIFDIIRLSCLAPVQEGNKCQKKRAKLFEKLSFIRFGTLILVFTIYCNSLKAQDFPRNNPYLLLGKTVKAKELPEGHRKYGYSKFFIKFDKNKRQFPKNGFYTNRPFLSKTAVGKSDYYKLVGKEFKVVSVTRTIPLVSLVKDEYAIELESNELGTLYYSYNPEFERAYELEVVGGLDYPDGFYSDLITLQTQVNDNGEYLFFISPFEKGIRFYAVQHESTCYFYLDLRIHHKYIKEDRSDVAIEFEDGSSFIKPKIKFELTEGKYTYGPNPILLSSDEIDIFMQKKIISKTIGDYTRFLDKAESYKLREYVKCIAK